MFRNNGKEFKRDSLNVVFTDGGVGDCVARTPALIYMRKHLPWLDFYCYVPDYYVDFLKNVLRDTIIRGLSKKERYNKYFGLVKTDCQQHDNMATHLTDHGFNLLVNKQVDIKHKNYPKVNLNKVDISEFTLPEKFVVVTTGYTSEVREFRPEVINQVCNYIKQQGYEIVFLGSNSINNGVGGIIEGQFKTDIDFSVGLDLRNQTTLLEAAKIISKAKTIVGVDNGLLHIAGCTDVPIVFGLTTVSGECRLPYRNNELGWNCYPVEPDFENVPCKFCQSNWSLLYGHDFRKCFYGDVKCVSDLTFDKWKTQLEKVL